MMVSTAVQIAPHPLSLLQLQPIEEGEISGLDAITYFSLVTTWYPESNGLSSAIVCIGFLLQVAVLF